MMNKGVIYIIGGQKFSRWTLRSVISLRQNAGEAGKLPVHIHFIGKYCYEDQFNSLGCTCIKHSYDGKEPFSPLHRRYRSAIMQETPFDKFVMLDSDTFIQGDFIDFFKLTPDDGIAGAEDGKFENHLQMARSFFLKKKLSTDEVRKQTIRLLYVDYGAKEDFPPYYNCGSVCFSKKASEKIGKELFAVLAAIQNDPIYNTHDDQLPFNSVVHRLKINAASINPIYNYTRSRMKGNQKKGIHDKIKEDVRIIHNRHYAREADWINTEPIEAELNRLLPK